MNRLLLSETSSPLPNINLVTLVTPVAFSRRRLPRISLVRETAAVRPVLATYVTMHLTIDAANTGRLRQLAFTVAGDSLASVRVQPVLQTDRMHVWLCLKSEALDAVMDAIMRRLPRAQFGYFKAG